MTLSDLHHYLQPKDISFSAIEYNPLQYGAQLHSFESIEDAVANAHVVILGCTEMRGNQGISITGNNIKNVRKQFYQLYNWHQNIKVVDIGDIINDSTMANAKAALSSVLAILHEHKKLVVLIGGSHDLTIEQYLAFKLHEEIIDVAVVDNLIDLQENEGEITSANFLYELYTSAPNYIRNSSVIGFQSFETNPQVVETLDKLHFDCMRLGKLRSDMNLAEPFIRHSDMVSIDINVIKHSDAPANTNGTPSGLHGDEACNITYYAGMSDKCCSLGIYGYNNTTDVNDVTAKQIAQMVWYFVDGINTRNTEADINTKADYIEYKIMQSAINTSFLKSMRTNRWWITLPNGNYYPCSYQDYLLASEGGVPDVWIKEVNREDD
jgi:formiminoglutamase